jgi:2-phosphoglycolate phosphatase
MTSRKVLVFDLDGTLIDSRGDIAAAANYGLSQLGRPTLSVATICGFVGNGAPYLLRCVADAAPGGVLDEEEFRSLSAHFHAYYRSHPVDLSTVLPGAEAALSLPNRRFALCTNKPRSLTDLVVAGLGWNERFEAVVGGGDSPHKKPHRGPLDLVAELLRVAPHDLIIIGDGPQDIGAGHAVGAYTIGVRGGFLDETLLIEALPHVILDTLVQLPAYLESQNL